MPQKHTRPVPGGRGLWRTERLWTLAASLPVIMIPVAQVREFDEDCWFHGRPATIRDVARHAQRIREADASYPIILCADGRLMDGGHRLAKAWIEGRAEIAAVRFPVTPEPDEILPAEAG